MRLRADRLAILLAAPLLAASLLSGCAATPKPPVAQELFVVVPGSDGHVGAIVVQHDGRQQVIDKPYGATRVRPEGSADTLGKA